MRTALWRDKAWSTENEHNLKDYKAGLNGRSQTPYVMDSQTYIEEVWVVGRNAKDDRNAVLYINR